MHATHHMCTPLPPAELSIYRCSLAPLSLTEAALLPSVQLLTWEPNTSVEDAWKRLLAACCSAQISPQRTDGLTVHVYLGSIPDDLFGGAEFEFVVNGIVMLGRLSGMQRRFWKWSCAAMPTHLSSSFRQAVVPRW